MKIPKLVKGLFDMVEYHGLSKGEFKLLVETKTKLVNRANSLCHSMLLQEMLAHPIA